MKPGKSSKGTRVTLLVGGGVFVVLGLVVAVCVANRDLLLERHYLAQLDEEDPELRLEAIRRLGELRSRRAVPLLVEMTVVEGSLDGPAQEALEAIGMTAAIGPLLDVLADDARRPEVRQNAETLLIRLGIREEASSLLPAMFARMSGEETQRTYAIVYVLQEILLRNEKKPDPTPTAAANPWTWGQPVPPTPPAGAPATGEEPLVRSDPIRADEIVVQFQRCDAKTRALLVDLFAQMASQTPVVVPVIASALLDESAEVRVNAVAAVSNLENLGDVATDTVPPLIRALSDPSSDVVSIAISALELAGRDAIAAAPALREIIAKGDELAHQAADALAGIAPSELILAARNENPEVRSLVIGTLARSNADEAIELCVDFATSDPDHDLRVLCVDALAQFGKRARAAAPALLTLLAKTAAPNASGAKNGEAAAPPAERESGEDRERRETLRYSVAQALGRIRADSQDVVPALLTVFEDGEERVEIRAAAAYALGEFGQDAVSVVPSLVRHLEDAEMSDTAALALIEFPRLAVPRFLERLSGDNQQARDSSLAALAQIVQSRKVQDLLPDIATGLAALLRADDDDTRALAAQSLAVIGPAAADAATDGLAAGLDDDDVTLRLTFALSLVQVAPDAAQRAAPTLAAVLEGREFDGESRLEIVEALPSLGVAAVPAWKAALADDMAEVRLAAAERVGELGAEWVEDSTASSETAAAAKELERALRKLFDDDEPVVSDAARTACKLVRGEPIGDVDADDADSVDSSGSGDESDDDDLDDLDEGLEDDLGTEEL